MQCSSYNIRLNQRNGERSQSKFLTPNARVINKYSLVWTEVPSEKPSESRLKIFHFGEQNTKEKSSLTRETEAP